MDNGDASIDEFIARRWDDAKRELEDRDPGYVHSLETAARPSLQGIYLPPAVLKGRLPKAWTELLETCIDVRWTIELLRCAAEGLRDEEYEGLDDVQAGRRASYHLTSWIHHLYAVSEKVKKLITLTCKLYLDDARRKRIRQKHHKLLDDRLDKTLLKARIPLAHGAGGSGTVMRSVTELGGWEPAVTLKIMPITILESSNRVEADLRPKWHRQRVGQTRGVEILVGQILASLEKELSRNSEPC